MKELAGHYYESVGWITTQLSRMVVRWKQSGILLRLLDELFVWVHVRANGKGNWISSNCKNDVYSVAWSRCPSNIGNRTKGSQYQKHWSMAGWLLNDTRSDRIKWRPLLRRDFSVMKALDMILIYVNVNGGAVALGHPLGWYRAKLSGSDVQRTEKHKIEIRKSTGCGRWRSRVAGVYELLK